MDSVREKLPADSLAALSALVRILGSGEMARGLFDESRPPRVRPSRGKLKKPRAPKRPPRRG